MSKVAELEARLQECTGKLNTLSKLLQEEINEINEITKIITGAYPDISGELMEEAKESLKNEQMLIGVNSIFVKYLSSETISEGKGKICVSNDFCLYAADISTTIPERLLTWPDGFYRNAKTKVTQLLLKTDSYIVCIDGLPGNAVTITTYPRINNVIKPSELITELEEHLLTITLNLFKDTTNA